jgi:hypothetical protein
MGAGISDLDWGRDWGPNRDMWGHIPDGMQKPPQQVWSELYRKGAPPEGRGYIPKTIQVGEEFTSIFPGQNEDILKSFGPQLQGGLLCADGESCPQLNQAKNVMYGMKFASVNPNPKGWHPTKVEGVGLTCVPQHFPFVSEERNAPLCDMRDFRNGAPIVEQFPGGWQSKVTQVALPYGNQPGFQYKDPIVQKSGNQVNVMDEWLRSIELVVAAYKNNEFEELDRVNSLDTKDWDPCDGGESALIKILPVLSGAFTAWGSGLFDLTPVLGADANFVFRVGSFLVGYHVAMYVYAVGDSFFGGDRNAKEKYEDAIAQDITVSLGIIGGIALTPSIQNALWEYNTNEYVIMIPTSAILAKFADSWVAPFLAIQIQRGGFLASPIAFGIALTKTVFHAIEYTVCRIGHWGEEACLGKEFPDSRLWDVGSLAALLTDKAIDDYWHCNRNDPRAEFMMRGFLLSPAFMWAGTSEDNFPGLYSKYLTNPLGLIMPIDSVVNTNEDGTILITDPNNPRNDYQATALGNAFSGFLLSWSGEEDPIAWGAGVLRNRFACQNFKVLLKGDETATSDSPSDWQDVDIAVAENLKTWSDSLRRKAEDPSNIYAVGQIKGTLGQFQVPDLYSIEVYIDTCMKDRDTRKGTGFNTVDDRGRFAQVLLGEELANKNPGDEHDIELTILTANTIFQYGTLAAGWSLFVKAWGSMYPDNLAALAHYIYDQEFWGWKQKADFYGVFEQGYEGVKDYKESHAKKPWQPTGLLVPLQPAKIPLSPTCGEIMKGVAAMPLSENENALAVVWAALQKVTPEITKFGGQMEAFCGESYGLIVVLNVLLADVWGFGGVPPSYNYNTSMTKILHGLYTKETQKAIAEVIIDRMEWLWRMPPPQGFDDNTRNVLLKWYNY